MKELITKSFWRGVTKTFHEALEGAPPKLNSAQAPEVEPTAPPNSKTQSSSDHQTNTVNESPQRPSD